ncbi:MAG: DUF499 domain-containing protein [bacterium]|nr:DUF499 domain-containing protein [bacterium]
MSLPSWWQVATPHKDIREGKLSEAIFACDLGDVVNGKAPLEYQDASIFFQKTHLTHGLNNLVNNVLTRLTDGTGDPVIQLQTPFGGGKTHALVTLYHLIKHRKKIDHICEIANLPKPKQAQVAVFVGTQADALAGKTPWGALADQLGQYALVKEHDKNRIAPGKEKLKQIIDASGPTLILIDELLEYIVKANRAEQVTKTTRGQTLAFLHEISEVVAASEHCALVITLPSSILEQYDEEAERSLRQLQKISGRIETIYTPVEGMEYYEVIRKRLFENLGDEKVRKQVAESYFSLYQSLSTEVPSEVKEVAYRERILCAYPFHPELIDVLYERWGSISTFQRTRGVLRLLAEVIADLYQRKVVSPLIHSALVNLANQTIRREFINHIGNEFESVIASDIAGQNAKSLKIDKEMGSEYEKYNIAQGIATAVFLYSFSGGEHNWTTLPRIRISLLREGIPATIVGDAVAKLADELWYFHSENNQYAFRNQPNLNRVILDREETITEERIQEELYVLLEKYAGRALEIYLWPKESSDIPDNKNLKLAILSPDYGYDSAKGKQLTTELFEKAGIGFRIYKNTLFTLAMDTHQHLVLTKLIRQYLALSDIQNDKSLLETLTKPTREELKKKSIEIEKKIPFEILNAYRYLALMENSGLGWKDLGIPTIGTSQTISERVKQYLCDQEIILTAVTPKYLLDKTFGKDESQKSVREIYELFLKTPGMPIPESEKIILNAVEQGCESGILGIQVGNEIKYKQRVLPDMDAVVMRGAIAEKMMKEKEAEGQPRGTAEQPPETPTGTGTIPPVSEPTTGPAPIVRRVNIRATVPWDKLSHVMKGVIGPLKEKGGAVPEITIEIRAESLPGYDRTTLDSKVKETLHQIGADIKDWKEEP